MPFGPERRTVEAFEGADPSEISGARRQNTRARPPKKLEVYLIDEKPSIFVNERAT